MKNIISIRKGSGGFNKYFESAQEANEYISTNETIIKRYNFTPDIINKLYRLSDGQVPFTINESYNEIKLRRFFQDNPMLLQDLGEFDKTKSHFRFNGSTALAKVGDGCFSSRSKSGSNTEPQELLFCDMINNDGNIDFYEALKQYNLDKSFEHSAKQQYIRIHEFVDDNKYLAFRPSNDTSSLNMKLTKIYNSKQVFRGAKTSYITPADVYIVRQNDIEKVEHIFDSILDSFKDTNMNYDMMFDNCKHEFMSLFNAKIFIPVSLKKIGPGNGHIPEILNVNEYTINIDKTHYSLRLTDSGFIGHFIIDNGDIIKFNFRSNQKTIYPLTFEFNKTGDGGAVGKFKTFVEDYIKSSDIDCNLPSVDEFYIKYKENCEFNIKRFYLEKMKIANKLPNFEDPYYDDDKLSQIESNDKSFYILVVCLLFIEFLYKLYMKDEFFKFIEDCYMASKKITKYSLPYLLIK